jgi:hypothetical protein
MMMFSLIDNEHEIELNNLSRDELEVECATTFDNEILNDMKVGQSFNIGTSIVTRTS